MARRLARKENEKSKERKEEKEGKRYEGYLKRTREKYWDVKRVIEREVSEGKS